MISANAVVPPKKSGAPGKVKNGQDSGGKTPGGQDSSGTGKGKGKGKSDKSSKKNDKNSKSNSGDVSGSDSDASTKGNPGKTGKQVDPKQLCCIRHLWGLCEDPSKCKHNPHLDKPTTGIKEHFFYKKLHKRFGPPTGPGNPPPNATDKDRA